MSKHVIIPEAYSPALGLKDTEKAIREIKEFFQTNLAFELNLSRVTAPIFVRANTGINDTLNGTERPVSFPVKHLDDSRAEIVHSLAKWKRLMLAEYNFSTGEGLYTDMNAIRADETLDNIHSLYVDQWDWELVMSEKQRDLAFLKSIVRKIYSVIVRTEKYICYKHENLNPILPEDIAFIHTKDLENEYPGLSPHEREYRASKKYGAVFLIGIGSILPGGMPHDGRAPDYDDWSTPTVNGNFGLNGDIIVYYPVLDRQYELSSMGIRVDKTALQRQLELRGEQDRASLYFHKQLLSGNLPHSIGGGIGQSRLCMLFLQKAHIGEIQCSIWPDEMVSLCRKHNIILL